MPNLIDQGYKKAIEVLKQNSTNFGFKASARHYNSVWARDGIISLLGALLIEDKKILETSRLTLETLLKYQTPLGQIPRTFLLDKKIANYYALDANSWWVIGVERYFSRTRDKRFLVRFWPFVKKAVLWINYQVRDESGLVDAPISSDWMDSSITRHGKLLYTNCLYLKAIDCFNELAEIIGEKKLNLSPFNKEGKDYIKELKKKINLVFWPGEKSRKILSTWHHTEFFENAIQSKREYYIDYISFGHYDDRCDVLANILSILFDVTDRRKQQKILNYFKREGISDPYPVKVLNPPIFYQDPTWNPKLDLYLKEPHQNLPFCYHNGGIWPYVGGFYILALTKAGFRKKAKEELEKLAQACKLGKESQWEFNEWLHGKNGKPRGATFQAWSAASYIIAYKAVIEGILIFKF